MNDIITGFRNSKAFRKKRLKKTGVETESTARGVAALATPLTYARPLLKMVQYLTEQSEPCTHRTVVARLDVIGGEDILVNEVCVQSSYYEKQSDIKLNSVTPTNYEDSIEYFRSINHARQNYYTAAMKLGEMLERGWVKGDAEGWMKYMEWAREEERKWKEKCRYSHEKRELDKRSVYAEDDRGLCWRIRRLYKFSKSYVISVTRYMCTCCKKAL